MLVIRTLQVIESAGNCPTSEVDGDGLRVPSKERPHTTLTSHKPNVNPTRLRRSTERSLASSTGELSPLPQMLMAWHVAGAKVSGGKLSRLRSKMQ